MLKPKNIIVVGGNAAGPAAAAKAKRTAPDADVTMFEAGNFISTGTCELPYVLSGEIKNYDEIVFYNPEKFEYEKGVKVFVNHLVEAIDGRNKKIIVRNLISNEAFKKSYDRLILTTGSKLKKLPSVCSDLKNVFPLKTVLNLVSIQDYLKKNPVKKVLIIGAGYIGLEAADAFKKLNCEVSIIEKTKYPLPAADEEIQKLILDILGKNSVEYFGNICDPKFIVKDDKIISINLNSRILEFDLVITATGLEPNNELAVSAKLQKGKYGGLRINNKLQTSDPNIYAAGDNIEVLNKITNQYEYFPLATLASQYGHIAGENAAGGNSYIKPYVKNIAVKVFDISITIVGINTTEAVLNNFSFTSMSSIVPNLVKVMPDSKNVFGKIIYDKNTKMILGASFVGGQEVTGYADLISLMINNKINVLELANNNYNYTPPLSPFVNLLSVLGRKIKTES